MFIQDVGIAPNTDQIKSRQTTFLKVDRRGFLGGVGLVLGVTLAGCGPRPGVAGELNDAEGGQTNPLADVQGGDANPSLWIKIGDDNKVKIVCHRSELGQQVWTSMAQIVVDELEADWKDVEIIQALGDPKYGDQNTDGSRSVRYNFHRLRVAGAAMRAMLVQAAATKWSVGIEACVAEQGAVSLIDGSKTLTYGELAASAARLQPPAENDITLKSRDQWRLIGKEVPSLTVPLIVKGEGVFGIDVQLPDMVYAVVARPPQVFGTPGAIDATGALATPGVLTTVRLPDAAPPALFKPLGGVAVVATNTWAAIQGRNALSIEWIDGPNAEYDSSAYAETLRQMAQQPGAATRSEGDVDLALQKADRRLKAEYYAPHLSQSPMEPPVATAMWTDGALECWACVQDPQETRNTLAGLLNIPVEKIKVHATWVGGAFGRKSKPDFVVEAAIVAREVGKPVKLQWTREDEVRHGYYHAVSAQHLEAGLNEDGTCTSWLHRSVFPPIASTFTGGVGADAPGEMGLGATDMPFQVANVRVEGRQAPALLRIGWLRSVANVYHAFAVQSFAAELAHAAGRDQKDYLLELIGPPRQIDLAAGGAKYSNYGAPIEDYPLDTGRLSHVLRVAADRAGWGRPLGQGKGLGIAVHRSFLTYVATVVEVDVSEDGNIRIPGVWIAYDAGTVVNPRHARDQMEGGTVYALSNAMYGAITAKSGAVEQTNFPDWRMMRMHESPLEIDVAHIESDAPPGGVGEPGSPPAAPALANAIFAATGKRIRKLPILGPDTDQLALG